MAPLSAPQQGLRLERRACWERFRALACSRAQRSSALCLQCESLRVAEVSVRLRTDGTFMALMAGESECHEEDIICHGKHEARALEPGGRNEDCILLSPFPQEQILKRFLLNEVQKTLSQSCEMPKALQDLRVLEVLEEE